MSDILTWLVIFAALITGSYYSIKMFILVTSRNDTVISDGVFIKRRGRYKHPQDKVPDSYIIEWMAGYFGLTLEELKYNRGRTTGVRQMTMFLIRDLTYCSLEEIAQMFDKNHATVIRSLYKVEQTMYDRSIELKRCIINDWEEE